MQPRLGTLLLLLAAGCGGTTDPTSRVDARVYFAQMGSDSVPSGVAFPATVRAALGELVILGIIDTPNPCQELGAVMLTRPGMVTVRVEARTRPEPCIAVVARFAYRVAHPIAPGPQRVVILHGQADRGAIFTVVRDTVVQRP